MFPQLTTLFFFLTIGNFSVSVFVEQVNNKQERERDKKVYILFLSFDETGRCHPTQCQESKWVQHWIYCCRWKHLPDESWLWHSDCALPSAWRVWHKLGTGNLSSGDLVWSAASYPTIALCDIYLWWIAAWSCDWTMHMKTRLSRPHATPPQEGVQHLELKCGNAGYPFAPLIPKRLHCWNKFHFWWPHLW